MIVAGGPDSVTRDGSPRAPQIIFDAKVPILSICYGQQTTALQLGGVVEGGHAAEFGRAEITIKEKCALFDGFLPGAVQSAGPGQHPLAAPSRFRL